MAFGIDDALATAAAAVSLTDTLVETIKKYRHAKEDYDLELLLEEVRITALSRIDDADLALTQFERMLRDRNIDPTERLSDVIENTPFWRPFEQFRLKQIRKRFEAFSDCVYCAVDDIAALLRCRDRGGEMGAAVVDAAKRKHDLHYRLVNAESLGESIRLLREQLVAHKAALTS